jgi:hypothetical protein
MPASPAEQLTKLNQALAADQSQSTDLAKEIDRLKNQIANLTKSLAEIDQKGQLWGKGAQAATQQQADLAAYVKTKQAMLEATIANAKDVSDKKAAALQELAERQKGVDDATAAAAKKLDDWTKAKAASAAAANAYNSYANLSSLNDASFKDLNALRTSAEKEGTATNFSRMYFDVLVMGDVLKKLVLPSADDYNTELDNRASALADADQAEKLAKIASDNAAADVIQKQKDLDADRASWRQKVLDSIPPGGAAAGPLGAAPAAPEAAPAQAPAAPAAAADAQAPAPAQAPAEPGH